MSLSPELLAFARLTQEPVIVLDAALRVRLLTAAARAIADVADAKHAGDLAEDVEALRDMLRRASGGSAPIVGALRLKTGRQIKTFATVLTRAPERLFALRLERPADDRFRQLSDRVRDLNEEVARRRSMQARLEEALAQRQILFSELQHRVKNNLQLMLALFAAARRQAASPEQLAFATALHKKLEAIAAAQHTMYVADGAQGVPARELAAAACRAHQPVGGEAARCIVDGDDSLILNDQAFPLALILNELVANALKYGSTEPGSLVRVDLRRVGAGHELNVEDEGPGFIPSEGGPAHTGLGLVRGLCRQIGGALSVERRDGGRGARVVVRFGGDRGP